MSVTRKHSNRKVQPWILIRDAVSGLYNLLKFGLDCGQTVDLNEDIEPLFGLRNMLSVFKLWLTLQLESAKCDSVSGSSNLLEPLFALRKIRDVLTLHLMVPLESAKSDLPES